MKKPIDILKQSVESHVGVVEQTLVKCSETIVALCDIAVKQLKKGNKLVFMGNGGSAADSQHLAAEFVGRFVKERHPLPAIALTTDTSILTAVGNDYGYENVFVRQVQALCNEGDVIIGISTSGNSASIIKAMEAGKSKNCFTIALTGRDGGKMLNVAELSIVIPSLVTARIQEAHILIGHILCEYCDEQFN